MTISYNWLSTYLPVTIEPERLSKILTSLGLEVESLEKYESIPGSLQGLLIGEVLSCEKHPDADKLTLTKVNIGNGEPLSIVCGAPNVAAGQKVVVAPVGSTIYPIKGDPITMKKAKIRGQESQGMICAEDEIGLGESHAGIMVLNADAKTGTSATDYFKPYTDWIYEIGLTPNRMDAMSHLGVARDVCAYLNHHDRMTAAVKSPLRNVAFKVDNAAGLAITVEIENTEACQRYAGVSITGITVKESPVWLKNYLKAIGLRPINNVVDVTNFILHETGQPLHAFDAREIQDGKVVVKNLPDGTSFVTLDEKERKLNGEDLMICHAGGEAMCIGGVFGGLHSGVSDTTTDVFLESAWFNPVSIRKTSLRHGLRTDAAARFEKGVDISQTVNVLKRAAMLIKEVAGGEIASEVVDVYPHPKERTQVALKYHYLKKLSGKNYHPDAIKSILEALGFEFIKEGVDDLWFAVPYSKPDISLPADVVEEIMRVDGYDNVEIPTAINMSPAAETLGDTENKREKLSNYLAGLGFSEMITNAITNSRYYSQDVLQGSVKLLNNLSAELDIMRPSVLETGLEVIRHNLNRKNQNLRLFEFGKTYHQQAAGQYAEVPRMALFVTGEVQPAGWDHKASEANFYYLKGVLENLLAAANINPRQLKQEAHARGMVYWWGKNELCSVTQVDAAVLGAFDIKQPVYYAEANWNVLLEAASDRKIEYAELPRFPSVERDLALVLDKAATYAQVEQAAQKARVGKLTAMRLFDVFESEKLGAGKKSMAVNFTFYDPEKTLTDKETDGFMQKLVKAFEQELQAEIRK